MTNIKEFLSKDNLLKMTQEELMSLWWFFRMYS